VPTRPDAGAVHRGCRRLGHRLGDHPGPGDGLVLRRGAGPGGDRRRLVPQPTGRAYLLLAGDAPVGYGELWIDDDEVEFASARVGEHLKVLRHKITNAASPAPGTQVTGDLAGGIDDGPRCGVAILRTLGAHAGPGQWTYVQRATPAGRVSREEAIVDGSTAGPVQVPPHQPWGSTALITVFNAVADGIGGVYVTTHSVLITLVAAVAATFLISLILIVGR
jgi:hypothetical protein